MKQLKLQLETLTCPTCIKKIEGALSKTEGVESAKVLFNSSKVKVKFDDTIISSEQISETIEQLGYSVLQVA
ncbi:heavy-metal-associated domain-containing protein [Staphylococcus sp. HMSC061G12]|uniref:heavy-metal-associated domain-containing protein n=1 Tax=Staphylococcus sp. HMSC061G12 TaxID=1739441 RepID=UPI0008A9A31D|nr:heavy-metal-associated domain-containing protein [Staphylococcus sp. HMSC061G12]OHR58242.1 heavy metal-binding protein [Staphylococcus sp. HMSC061G12]